MAVFIRRRPYDLRLMGFHEAHVHLSTLHPVTFKDINTLTHGGHRCGFTSHLPGKVRLPWNTFLQGFSSLQQEGPLPGRYPRNYRN